MKPISLLFILLLGAQLPLVAQYELDIRTENSCSYYGEEITDKVYGFSSSREAEDIVRDILDIVGLKPNFMIKAGNVPNALATIQNGERMIIYSQNFILQINNSTGTDWAGISILAHEIGHHLNGHTISGTGSRPPLELESDEFSGFILGKMGASLNEAQSAINKAGSNSGSATHPPKSARLEAIAVGWNKATSEMRSRPVEEKKTTTPQIREGYDPYQKPVDPITTSRPQMTSINVAYTGDAYNCMLPITITIGGMSFQPQGNLFTVSNIPTGSQPYQISGQVQCGAYGNCSAYGEGVLDIRQGMTYYVGWQNTAVGQCSIWLVAQ
ncbi:MAG: hypothetical protein KDC44_02405 [Phaeodactylibacter sp.]|nr:hypothetical protein [Phaeodactylibacter sp.]